MFLPLAIGVDAIDPDAPDPSFVVDRQAFRLEVEAWAEPAATAVDQDTLCTVSLFAGPEAARAELVSCPAEVASSVSTALEAWRLQVSTAPSTEAEVLRLAWLFRADGSVQGFVSTPRAIGRRLPGELMAVAAAQPSRGWTGCIGCEFWSCEVTVEVDAGGRPTATTVSSTDAPDRCPQEAWPDVRDAAEALPWAVVGSDGWPAAYESTAWVQIRSRAVATALPLIELRDRLPTDP